MERIYTTIEKLLRASAKKHNLLIQRAVLDSTAKTPKKQLHLYGRKEVQIFKRPKQKTYVVGVMANKNSIGFYSMAVYGFPKEFKLSPTFKKTLNGKSCFQIKALDAALEKEIGYVIEKSITLFKKEGWI